MELSPHLGIGDLLMLKMGTVSNSEISIKIINISVDLVNSCRLEPEKYISFLEQLLKLLFPNIRINKLKCGYKNILYPITKCYIYDNIEFNKPIIEFNNYIIFHSKVRMDGFMKQFLHSDILHINNCLNTFKSNKTILLLVVSNIYYFYILFLIMLDFLTFVLLGCVSVLFQEDNS